MKKISKPSDTEYALYYEKFIHLVKEDMSVLDQMKENAKQIEQLFLSLPEEALRRPYALGKWSMKDILMHLTDGERVFLCRAMRFARNDKASQPFFDENEFAKEAKANLIPVKRILKEYKTSRQASLAFFSNQSSEILKRKGMASNTPMSVRACAWVICGHEIHHWNVIRERYLGM